MAEAKSKTETITLTEVTLILTREEALTLEDELGNSSNAEVGGIYEALFDLRNVGGGY